VTLKFKRDVYDVKICVQGAVIMYNNDFLDMFLICYDIFMVILEGYSIIVSVKQ